MHPCCWGNLFRELCQFLPFLAAAAFALKQLAGPLWRGIRNLVGLKGKKGPEAGAATQRSPLAVSVVENDAVPSCCAAKRAKE